MPKKNVVKLLCMGALIAGLLFGCGRSQPVEIAEDEEVTAKIAEDEEVTAASVDDLATEAEISKKDGTFDKIKDKKTKAEAYEVYTEETSEEEAFRQTDCEELLGIWALTFDFAPLIEEELVELDSMYLDFHEKFDITTKLTFNADGTFSWVVDEEALSATWDTYVKSLAQFDADYVYDQYEAEGYTTQDAEDYFQKQYGMSVYDAVYEDWLNNFYTLEDISGGFSISGVYEARGNEVHMDEYKVQDNVYDIFTVEGDTLTLNPPPGAEEDPTGIEGFDYPYVFTRVVE